MSTPEGPTADLWLVIVQDGPTQLIDEGGDTACFVDGRDAATWALRFVADASSVLPAVYPPDDPFKGWTPKPGDDVADWPDVFACKGHGGTDLDIRVRPIDLYLGTEMQEHYDARDDLHTFLTETCGGPEDFGVDNARWQRWLAALDRGAL